MADHPAGVERELHHRDLDPDPIAQFRRWLDDAEAAGVPMANAMGLATADADGHPSVRHVLLRGLDRRGFVFFTNHGSRKARQLEENPHAGLVFLWKALERQVNVTGSVERISREESETYFGTRSKQARIGAWASRQSEILASREDLDARVEAIEARFAGREVPLPPFWGGFRVRPDTVELWQGRVHRLHDRFRYTREPTGTTWRVDRLFP